MYRSGWANKPGQEVVLAIWLKRSAFDLILAQAVAAKFIPELYSTTQEWQKAIQSYSVRLQWDHDRTLRGGRLARRAIQLGLQGDALVAYARDWILHIENISKLEREHYEFVISARFNELLVPAESIYPVTDIATKRNLQLSIF